MNTPLSTAIALIIKRDGSIVAFDQTKIATAVAKALRAADEGSAESPYRIARGVVKRLEARKEKNEQFIATVEGVQDDVEAELIAQNFPKTAKAYILYRAERNRARYTSRPISDRVRTLNEESKKYFEGNPLGELVYLRTYARWIESEGRRETWIETVDRYISFMREQLGEKLTENEYQDVKEAILTQEVMPSMRLMQFAGEPARRCNTCAYNCTFIAPSSFKDFSEIMYLSMQGCGVGFSVESQNVESLPQIQKQNGTTLPRYTIPDSKEGWCDALYAGLSSWYRGEDISFDYSLIRPAGARLKTMGGKASGPDPLRSLLEFARKKIVSRQGRRLRPIDVHDIICKIGECVVSGGVRRTAMISLSDLDDPELRDAKKGQFFLTEPHRSIANNSAVYTTPPTSAEMMDEWIALMKSGSGERGIFNRGSIGHTLPARRKEYFAQKGFIDSNGVVSGPIGTNPCGEILLQSKQFCNLSEVIARSGDTAEMLTRKMRIAALVGTFQSSLSSFRYLSPEWKEHCEEERLLGVSITGQWDSEEARKPETLRALKEVAISVNAEYAKRFGITPSRAITAVKPSGTVSQTFNCSSGIHPRHSAYYVRRIRISATDSLFALLKDQGVPYVPEVGQSEENATTYVLEFPVKAPEGSTFKDDLSALDQLEYWKRVKVNYTEHNPSATISVGDDEWIDVLGWLQKNWNIIGGLSFLPRFEYVYQLAPYEAISKERYEELASRFPEIDYSKLITYEHTDETEQKRELACAGGTCELEALPFTETTSVDR